MTKLLREKEVTPEEARNAYYREYRKKNKKKIAEYNKNYREKNSEKIKEINRNYWVKKAEEMKKAK